MKNRPDGASLLRAARECLLRDLAGGSGGVDRYTVKMIARAMAIAARECEAGERARREELELFSGLYGEAVVEAAGTDLDSRLDTLNRRLAEDIRAGVLDGACGVGVRALLRLQITAQLAISNPRFLRRCGADESE